jgi:hypothetical protein
MFRITEANIDKSVRLELESCPVEKRAAAEALLSTVCGVLGASLRTELVSLEANFYEIGGNSLNSIFTITKLQELGYIIGKCDAF